MFIGAVLETFGFNHNDHFENEYFEKYGVRFDDETSSYKSQRMLMLLCCSKNRFRGFHIIYLVLQQQSLLIYSSYTSLLRLWIILDRLD